jgi:hypothetical protein
MIYLATADQVPYDPLIRALCAVPFKGRPEGCPNIGNKDGCPPRPMLTRNFDLSEGLYVIATEYPVGQFAERMRKLHPEWKEQEYPDIPQKGVDKLAELMQQLRQKRNDWPDEYYPPEKPESWISSRSWYNPRRWQPQARKMHNAELEKFAAEHRELKIDKCPEAQGINVTGLMANLGVTLNWQWPPPHSVDNKTYIISVAGKLKI